MRDDEKRMRYKVKLKAFLGENEYGGLNSIHPEVPQNLPPQATQLPMPQEM